MKTHSLLSVKNNSKLKHKNQINFLKAFEDTLIQKMKKTDPNIHCLFLNVIFLYNFSL